MDFQEFRKAEKENKILVGIDPTFARRFFTNLSKNESKELTGSSLFAERATIKMFMYLELLLLPLVLVFSILFLKWYSILVFTVYILVFLVLKLKASKANQQISPYVLFFIIMSGIALFLFRDDLYGFLFFIFVPLPFLCGKLVYKIATASLRNLVTDSANVYHLLLGKAVHIRHI